MDQINTDREKPGSAAEANGEVKLGTARKEREQAAKDGKADTLPPLRQGDIMRAAQQETQEMREAKADRQRDEGETGDSR
jgi:hypothetical protein